MYLFYNLFATPHVSNDHFIHHQEFINLLYLQLCLFYRHKNVLFLTFAVNETLCFCLFPSCNNKITISRCVSWRPTFTSTICTETSRFRGSIIVSIFFFLARIHIPVRE
jgi:hypothetical protein